MKPGTSTTGSVGSERPARAWQAAAAAGRGRTADGRGGLRATRALPGDRAQTRRPGEPRRAQEGSER